MFALNVFGAFDVVVLGRGVGVGCPVAVINHCFWG